MIFSWLLPRSFFCCCWYTHDFTSKQGNAELEGALVEIKRRESLGEHVEAQELENIVRVLLDKIDALEQAEEEGQRRVHRAERGLRDTMLQLACGGAAGATARTFVAPIDRVKILMQTQHVVSAAPGGAGAASAASAAPKYQSLSQSLRRIVAEEGVRKLWRGNGVNCIRVVPYSATQFVAYDKLKAGITEHLARNNGMGGGLGGQQFNILHRLACGAGAAVMATSLTYPLDMVRLRLSVEPQLNGFADSVRSILADGKGSPRAFFKGYVPTVCSITPFVAINFAAFDTCKSACFALRPSLEGSVSVTLMMGAASGLFAQTCCYPLDTVRRRMQLKGTVYTGLGDAFRTILRDEGFRGFYKGMLPNAVKVVPNNAIRFFAYETLKKYMGVEGRKRS
jgi:solute carrier family 25 phosphate transporter 23/24/25/41